MQKCCVIFFLFSVSLAFSQVAPTQGDVVINTFDAAYGGSNTTEFVVLINKTNTQIELNGYEVQSFAVSGNTSGFRYQWVSSYLLQPYTFLLIATTATVNGVTTDFSATTNGWATDGYICLRKQNPTSSSEYVDIVKHFDGSASFTGVPANSGINITDPDVNSGTLASNNLATRGGVSGNVSSLTYSGYNVAADFTTQSESGTTIQNSSSSPLPVELSSFSAIVLENAVKLNWRTETEVSNYGFEVERLQDYNIEKLQDWSKIGFVQGYGNSNSPKDYSFIDPNVSGGKYSYRLKQIDTDGKFEYSKVIEVEMGSPTKFELSQNYPNPFNPATTISFSLPQSGNAKLTVYNLLGEQVAELVNGFREAGVHTINFNAENFNSGLYIYKVEANGVVQSKKMTLVK